MPIERDILIRIENKVDQTHADVQSTRKQVDDIHGELYVGREGRQPVLVRLANVEENGQKSISPSGRNGRKELAIIAGLVAVVTGLVTLLTKLLAG